MIIHIKFETISLVVVQKLLFIFYWLTDNAQEKPWMRVINGYRRGRNAKDVWCDAVQRNNSLTLWSDCSKINNNTNAADAQLMRIRNAVTQQNHQKDAATVGQGFKQRT